MLRKLGVITAVAVAAASLFGPAAAHASLAVKTATVAHVVPFYYGYFLHAGAAEQEPPQNGTVYITAACEVTAVSATTVPYLSTTECYVLDLNTGARQFMFTTRAGITGAGGAGTYLLSPTHKYALCVQARHDSNTGTLITSAPCARIA